MTSPLRYLSSLLFSLSLTASAQTFTEGDYQLNRKKATSGFEVAELLAGSNITLTWNNTNKTVTIAGTGGSGSGTVTSFAATDSTGIDFTVTNPTTTPTLSLALTKAAVGLDLVENTALSPWPGSTNLTTLGTITTGNWEATPIDDTYISSAATWNAKLSDGDTLTTGLIFPITNGLRLHDTSADHTLSINAGEELTQDRALNFIVNDTSRTITLEGNLSVSAEADISGANTGDITLAGTPDYITLTNQVLTRSLIDLTTDVTGTLPIANGGVDPLVTTGDNGLGNGRLGLYETTLADFKYIDTGANGFEFGSERVSAASFQGDGSLLSGLSATNISSGTLPVTRGGTGASTLSANAVLLGNGTSTFQTVAPGTPNNVLTSNGTTWTSAAPAASGTKTIAVRSPRDNQPPAANFATLDSRNSIAILDFDTATEESAIFVGVIPEAAVLTSGLIVRITWAAATATSGDCRWGAQWMRCNTDIDSDSYDTATEATTTTNGTSGIPSVTTLTCTSIDSLAVGEMYRLRIYRDTGDAADTMAGDAELLTVEVRTAN